MRKYDISAMIVRPRGTSARIPVIQESAGFRRAYVAVMRRLVRQHGAAVREIILPSYKRAFTADTGANDFDELRLMMAQLTASVDQRINNLVRLESERHTANFAENARKAFSVNLQGVISNDDLTGYLETAAMRNASLVTGMTDDLFKKIQLSTTNSLIAGDGVGTLRKKLIDDLNVGKRRAELIARDQTSKLNADLNKIRHTQAGVDAYDWLTSADERVRKDHRAVNGKRYKYGQRTGVNTGAEPGQDIQCRCLAQGVVEFGEQPATAVSEQAVPSVAKLPAGVRVNKPLPEIPAPNRTAKFIVANDLAEQGSSLKDFDSDGLSEMLTTQHAINQRFGMKKLAAFGENRWATRKGKGLKGSARGVPGWFGMRHNVMAFNPIASSRQGLTELSMLSDAGMKRGVIKRLSAIEKIKDAELKRRALDFAGDFRFNSVRVTPSSIVIHENGHRFHANYYKSVESAVEGWDNGWQMLVSQYGTTNRHEFVAESFAIYVTDPAQHWRIKPELLAVFREKDLSL